MQSKSPDTQAESTWSGQDQEDGQQTDGATTKYPSDPSTSTSQPKTPEADDHSYVTSVAGGPVDEHDAAQFIHDLEEWYGDKDRHKT